MRFRIRTMLIATTFFLAVPPAQAQAGAQKPAGAPKAERAKGATDLEQVIEFVDSTEAEERRRAERERREEFDRQWGPDRVEWERRMVENATGKTRAPPQPGLIQRMRAKSRGTDLEQVIEFVDSAEAEQRKAERERREDFDRQWGPDRLEWERRMAANATREAAKAPPAPGLIERMRANSGSQGDPGAIEVPLLPETPASTGFAPSPFTDWMTGTFDNGGGNVFTLNRGSGSYVYANGTMTAERIDGTVVEGTWTQSSSGQQCKDGGYHGRFRITFAEDGFSGLFGYCDEPPGAPGGFQGKRRK